IHPTTLEVGDFCGKMLKLRIYSNLMQNNGAVPRACPHFKNGNKNEINGGQARKIAQIISRY
ncbi:MAG: hypothetical protein ACTIKO_06645, partial [Psychrobacter sp.]